MGVINLTPDSFSDGGFYLDPEKANSRASELIKDGADVLDLGPQSTRPMAMEVGAEEELRRLTPALLAIRKSNPKSIISVDTFNSKVAESALNMGANWINDISGGRRDPELLRIVAEAGCPYVLTHSRGDSKSMDDLTSYNHVTNDVCQGLLRRTDAAINAGLNLNQIIWDPGLGFAKTNEQNLTLLKEMEIICSQDFPVLVGPSRKRFIGSVLNQPNPDLRLWGTAAVTCRCVQAKVSMVRVHDVKEISEILLMANAIY